MLSKSKIKLIKSLEKKKSRVETGCFLAEGNKLVDDLLGSFTCEYLLAEKNWLESHEKIEVGEIIEAGHEEIRQASLLKNPQEVLAVFKIPSYPLDPNRIKSELTLALDDVQDPGNLGTIVRLSDWFGIQNIICSKGTADLYNPKTVQATMGAIGRVKVHYTDLPVFFKRISGSGLPVYGTFLHGNNIYEENLSPNGIVVMGNEGNGISPEVEKYIKKRLFIPAFPQGKNEMESLNVAIAAAITCAEFRRQSPSFQLSGS